MTLLPRDARIYVAGHRGLAGSAIWQGLSRQGFGDLHGYTSQQLDLRDGSATADALHQIKPDVVIVAAARVGGIGANISEPVDQLNDNLRIQTSIFEAAHRTGVARLLFLGSSCIYPRLAPQPIREDALLTGELEATNEAYAIAKISGLMAVRAYRAQHGRRWIAAMPTNLYGPRDNFDEVNGHVAAALMRRMHEAKIAGDPEVTVWGTGRPRRELMHADDLAAAAIFLLTHYDGDTHVNVGTGSDVTIRELAEIIRDVVGYRGELVWDSSRPDGTPRKVLDVSRMSALGWQARIPLRQGLTDTYSWYRANADRVPAQ